MKSKIVVLLIVGFAVAAGVSSYYGRANLAKELNAKMVHVPVTVGSNSIEINATPITLNPDNPRQTVLGELSYVEGWALTSESEDFGGWSGLVKRSSGFLAINDKGNWLEVMQDVGAEGKLVAGSISLFDPSVGEADKSDYDAESLVALSDGYLVGFEQEHRLMEVSSVGDMATPYDTGVDLSGLSSNSGIEAMALLPNGNLVMFAESGRDVKGRTPAWLVSDGSYKSLEFSPPENYEATDAASLPNGDVVLLMRYYSLLTGASAQVRHITAAEIESGVIRGRQIAEIRAPLNVDNMEGLDVQLLPDGTVRLFIISDDNFSSRQRTLFMVFDWAQDLGLEAKQ